MIDVLDEHSLTIIYKAQDLGLHRSRTQQQLAPHLIEPYKRLWWSAYVMDRWICAALGRYA